jgi:hypothetical protein
MDLVGMVRELVEATPNHHFDISRGFGGSEVGEIENLLFIVGILNEVGC